MATLAPAPLDEHLWLEDIKGEKALKWVEERNRESLSQLTSLPAYKKNEAEIKHIQLAKDRIARVMQMGPYLYNFWQDEVNVRGVWRRTTLTSYKQRNPKWETILDVDRLAKKEKENWL